MTSRYFKTGRNQSCTTLRVVIPGAKRLRESFNKGFEAACNRCFIIGAAVFLLSAQPAWSQETTVQLVNGSFEESVDGKPAGWSFSGSSTTREFTVVHDTDQAFIGQGSARIEASGDKDQPTSFGNFSQSFDVTPWRGKTVKFRAAVRVAESSGNGRAQLWFRVDGKRTDGKSDILAFDNMQDRPIVSREWKYHEITSKIPEASEKLIVGLLVFPTCTTWIDDVSLEVIDDATETTTEQFTARTQGTNAGTDTTQPFFNHWLWLVLIALSLFAISQFGRFGGAVNLQGEKVRFGWIKKFALRFSVVYWLLYCLPSPFTSLMFSWGMKFGQWYGQWTDKIVRWTSSDVLGIERDLLPPGGSGDTTFDFVRLFACFSVAILVAILWSLADRRKTDYRYVNDLLRSYLRYVLALTMLGYGLAKVGFVYNQFPEIGVGQLTKNWGDSSPMNVVWNFMGASRPYTIFAGLGEVAGCLLLIWRRTTTFGAMVSFGVMLNVVMLNFCYDVPVKQYSFHLMVMALFLILPDANRLANILFWNRPTISVKTKPPYTGKVTIWLHRLIKTYIIMVGVGLPVYNKIKTELDHEASLTTQPEWYGSYAVEDFQRDGEMVPPLTTDGNRWKSLSIQRFPWSESGGPGQTDRITIVMMDGSFAGGVCNWDESKNQISCPTNRPPKMKLTIKDDNITEIHGVDDDKDMFIRLRRVRREDFLLINRGFRWINERPYNR